MNGEIDNSKFIPSILANTDEDLDQLIERFIEEAKTYAEQITNAVSACDLEQARALAHRLRGAGGGYGYPCLTDKAAEIEIAAQSQDQDLATVSAEHLSDLVSRIILR